MLKAWLMGSAIIVGFFILDKFVGVNYLLFYSSQIVAAYVAAYYAPRQKFLLGMSMVPIIVVSFIVMTFIVELFINLWTTGESISQQVSELRLGPELAILLSIVILSSILCGLGSVIGVAMAKKFRKEIEPK